MASNGLDVTIIEIDCLECLAKPIVVKGLVGNSGDSRVTIHEDDLHGMWEGTEDVTKGVIGDTNISAFRNFVVVCEVTVGPVTASERPIT